MNILKWLIVAIILTAVTHVQGKKDSKGRGLWGKPKHRPPFNKPPKGSKTSDKTPGHDSTPGNSPYLGNCKKNAKENSACEVKGIDGTCEKPGNCANNRCQLKCVATGGPKPKPCQCAPTGPADGWYTVNSNGSATLHCCTGFKATGNMATCDTDGNWDTNSATCEKIVCDKNELPPGFRTSDSPPVFGSLAMLTCNRPQDICHIQDIVIRCQEDGTWSTSQAKCLSETDCPGPEWAYYDQSCYHLGDIPTSFYGATEYCNTSGLVYVTSIEESAFLANLLGKNVPPKSAWIGILHENSNGPYFFKYGDTNKTPIPFEWWGLGEPDFLSSDENCAVLSSILNYKWNDVLCSCHDILPLCEKKLC